MSTRRELRNDAHQTVEVAFGSPSATADVSAQTGCIATSQVGDAVPAQQAHLGGFTR